MYLSLNMALRYCNTYNLNHQLCVGFFFFFFKTLLGNDHMKKFTNRLCRISIVILDQLKFPKCQSVYLISSLYSGPENFPCHAICNNSRLIEWGQAIVTTHTLPYKVRVCFVLL